MPSAGLGLKIGSADATDRHQPAHPVGVVRRDAGGDVAAHRVADDRDRARATCPSRKSSDGACGAAITGLLSHE